MISTTCECCQFKIMDNNEQIGCSIKILDKFKTANAEITEREVDGSTFKVINRVCQFRRTEDWSGNIYNETFIPATIVVLHKDNNPEFLLKTLDSISKIQTPKGIKIVVCHTTNNPKEMMELLAGKNITQVYVVESMYDNSIYDEAFKRCKNGWVFFAESGFMFDKDTLNILNFAVNEKMRTFLGIRGDGIEAYMAVVYKYFKGQLGTLLSEKLTEIDPTSMIDWNTIDEDYRLLHN